MLWCCKGSQTLLRQTTISSVAPSTHRSTESQWTMSPSGSLARFFLAAVPLQHQFLSLLFFFFETKKTETQKGLLTHCQSQRQNLTELKFKVKTLKYENKWLLMSNS